MIYSHNTPCMFTYLSQFVLLRPLTVEPPTGVCRKGTPPTSLRPLTLETPPSDLSVGPSPPPLSQLSVGQ
jgi:hypothetical protein